MMPQMPRKVPQQQKGQPQQGQRLVQPWHRVAGDGRQRHHQQGGRADQSRGHRCVPQHQAAYDAHRGRQRPGRPQAGLPQHLVEEVQRQRLHHQGQGRLGLGPGDFQQQALGQQLRVVDHHRHVGPRQKGAEEKGDVLQPADEGAVKGAGQVVVQGLEVLHEQERRQNHAGGALHQQSHPALLQLAADHVGALGHAHAGEHPAFIQKPGEVPRAQHRLQGAVLQAPAAPGAAA